MVYWTSKHHQIMWKLRSTKAIMSNVYAFIAAKGQDQKCHLGLTNDPVLMVDGLRIVSSGVSAVCLLEDCDYHDLVPRDAILQSGTAWNFNPAVEL